MRNDSETEFDRETDGRWIAEIPALPGVLAYGASRDEAQANAVTLAQQVEQDKLKDEGMPWKPTK
jgi:predicted RNase H-like HicB family nuclease